MTIDARTVLTAVIVLITIIALGLFLIAPSRSKRAQAWRGTRFAHRGLFDEKTPENTLEAFELACEKGFGIELDVRLSKDGEIVVFHDNTLERMTGDPRRVDEVELAQLQQLKLNGSGQIPTFEKTLELVKGRVPLLVEFKNGKHNKKLCLDAMALLRKYEGRYLVESFNPFIVGWMRKNTPDVVRGQLVGPARTYLKAKYGCLGAFFLSSLLLNAVSRPDFVGYDISPKRFVTPKIQRALFKTTMAAWTVRDEETYLKCLSRGEMPIFEGFVPKGD